MTVENKIQPFGVVPLTTELLTVLGRKCPSGRFASLLSRLACGRETLLNLLDSL